MRGLFLALIGAASFAATVSVVEPAAAADGCGRGWFWNGYACAPARQAQRHFGPPAVYYGHPGYHRYGRQGPSINELAGCPRGWTLQSGTCKPYRGY